MRKTTLLIILWASTGLLAREPQGIQYLFPKPGTGQHPRETVLIFRFHTTPDHIQNRDSFFTITGEVSGPISGVLVEGTDGRTLVFRPAVDFYPGETVIVELRPRRPDGILIADTVYSFTVSPQRESPFSRRKREAISHLGGTNRSQYTPYMADPLVLNGVSIPSNFPKALIDVNDNPSPGVVFRNAWSGGTWSMILDNEGNPVWYWHHWVEQMNFQKQPDGRITVGTFDDNGYYVIAWDSTYTKQGEYRAPPGYWMDDHEFISLPSGHYWLIAADDRIVDMSVLVPGGRTNATVVANHVVEMDANDNPVFIWRSWDYFDIVDATHWDLTDEWIDFIHMNSLDLDDDGNVIMSSRHLSECTKINRQTGAFMFRLGGKNDDFTWINDTDRISYQHTFFSLGNSHYTIFDNGNFHDPEYSRAIEVALDTVAWTAEIVWQYPEMKEIFCGAESSTQRLPSGNTFSNWTDTETPRINEVTPDGDITWQMRLGNGSGSYRGFKYPWKGKAAIPYLIAEPHYDRITLIFNKFGDTNIHHYNIYAGHDPEPTEVIDTSTKPFIHLRDLDNRTDYFFRVTAVDSSGVESGFSNQREVYVQIVPPGTNMVTNGGFTEGMKHWKYTTNGANASWDIVNGEFRFILINGGSQLSQVQMTHEDILLSEGASYLFEFDAYAASGRSFEAEVTRAGAPYTNFSRIGYTWLTTSKTHYAFNFVMTEPDEPDARIMLNAGGSNHDVFIDNVSLKQIVTAVEDNDRQLPRDFRLHQNYPNPFNPETVIVYDIPEMSRITLRIFNLRGELIETIVDGPYDPGSHWIVYNGSSLASGVYLYEIVADAVNSSSRYRKINKMMVIK